MTRSEFTAASGDPKRGAVWFAALLDAAGDGAHEFDIVAELDSHVIMTSMILLSEGATREADEETAPVVRDQLTALASGAYSGLILLRTDTGPGTARVSGWFVTQGQLLSFSPSMLSDRTIRTFRETEPGITVTYADAPEFRPVLNISDEDAKRGGTLFASLLDVAGNGIHSLTVGGRVDGLPVAYQLKLHIDGFKAYTDDLSEVAHGTHLMSALATGMHSGALILRTRTGPSTFQVRGWTADDGEITPLTRAEMFNGYWTNELGVPTPPEPGDDYCDAPQILGH